MRVADRARAIGRVSCGQIWIDQRAPDVGCCDVMGDPTQPTVSPASLADRRARQKLIDALVKAIRMLYWSGFFKNLKGPKSEGPK
jgi:hypothetical protein